jgi:hypothetical protein
MLAPLYAPSSLDVASKLLMGLAIGLGVGIVDGAGSLTGEAPEKPAPWRNHLTRARPMFPPACYGAEAAATEARTQLSEPEVVPTEGGRRLRSDLALAG